MNQLLDDLAAMLLDRNRSPEARGEVYRFFIDELRAVADELEETIRDDASEAPDDEH